MLEHTSYMAAPLRQFTIPVRPCVEHGGEHWADWHWSECPDCLHASHEELHYQVAVGLRTLLQCMYPRHCAAVQRPVTALDDSFAAHAPLQRLSNALRQNRKRGMTLAEAARIAGLEPAYFSRYFRQKTGKNFKAWNDARLMRIAAH